MSEKVKFADLFDLDEIQKIQDAFALASNVASIITEPDGTPITEPSNFCRLCMEIIRKTPKGLSNCMKSDAMLGRQNTSGPIMQPCLSGGLWDGGAGISVGDQHIANWLIGQVRNETQNDENMMKYADEIGADPEEFRAALCQVTRMSTEQFKNVCNSLFLFANQLSKLAYQNLRLRENQQLLEKFNQELEQRVAHRTAELAQSNQELGNAMSRLWSEMELAKKIQTVLLPKKPEISGYEIAASCDPAEEVGGDYYDVISVGGFDWIVIGDVSGHGVTAGLVMMMVQTSIHTVLTQNPEVPPSQLLRVINQTIYENIERMSESKHMTIIVLACGKDGFFDFSGLHEDILFWCAATKKVEKIETDGMWIGLEPDISGYLSDGALKMGPGDCIILYTDGITEAWAQGIGLFGTERLIKIIEKFGARSASEIHTAVLKELEPFEKPDDVTLLVMKRI
jgi:serine phosphatase RsbU (regulator of sigma subunit)